VSEGGGNVRALTIVLVLTTTFLIVEVVGGLLTGSLALLADAGHMASDSVSIGLALFAFWLSAKPVTPNRSFGYKRAEILAALVNGVSLVVISIWIFVEAVRRFQDPPEILGGWLLTVAVIGLFVNLAGATILMRFGARA
jgi:cobalt-zinc-cadmium efflux system protein